MRRMAVCANGNAVFRITVHQPNSSINVVRDPKLCCKTHPFSNLSLKTNIRKAGLF